MTKKKYSGDGFFCDQYRCVVEGGGDGTGRDFCKIPGSRDFPGRDLPHIFIPGFFGNCSGFFRIFLFDSIGDQFKHFSRAGKPNKHFFHQKNRPANCRREDLQRFAHAL